MLKFFALKKLDFNISGNYSGGCKAMYRTLLGVSKEFVHIAKAME